MIAKCEETWNPVEGFESNYQVSSMGRIRRISRQCGTRVGLTLKPYTNKHGYAVVTLCSQGAKTRKAVHKIVATAFLGSAKNGLEVNHINGVKTDNQADNLEWVTREGNTSHAMKMNLVPCGDRNGNRKLSSSQVLEIMTYSGSVISAVKQFSDKFGVSKTSIYDILSGKTWKHLREVSGAKAKSKGGK